MGSPTGSGEIGRVDRQARAATAGLFLSNGALFAGLLPRYPEIKSDLGLSNSALGAAVAAFAAGALVVGPIAGAALRRWGSARSAVGGAVLIALCALAAALAPNGAVLAAALFAAGAADAVTDVAQNAQGLAVQRRYGRFIINSLHAVWSMGAVLGGLIGVAAIAAGVPRAVQVGAAGVVFGGLCLAGYRRLLPESEHGRGSGPSSHRHPSGRVVAGLAALVAIAVAGAVIEDGASSWATLYLRESLHAPAALAATGYVAAVAAQFAGRLIGDRLTDRFGPAAVARSGGLIVAAGMGAALAWPGVAGTLVGFGAAGFGCATLVPGAMHAADDLPGLRPGTGLTVLTWLMRVGFLVAPLVVGAIADAVSLRVALLIVPAAGVAAAVLAGALNRPSPLGGAINPPSPLGGALNRPRRTTRW